MTNHTSLILKLYFLFTNYHFFQSFLTILPHFIDIDLFIVITYLKHFVKIINFLNLFFLTSQILLFTIYINSFFIRFYRFFLS